MRDGPRLIEGAAVSTLSCAYGVPCGTPRVPQLVSALAAGAEIATRPTLMAAAARHGEDALAFLRNREVFGDLVDNARFMEAYLTTLDALRTRGARAAVEQLVALKTHD